MKTEYSKEAEEILAGFRLLDDDFMTKVFDRNIEAAELVLRIILEDKNLKVTELTVQKVEKSPITKGRNITLDISVKDGSGNYADIEVQRDDKGADIRRARFHSAVLDSRMLKAGQEFKEIKESYVIFITETDVFGRGKAVYKIDRIFRDTGGLFGDGNHILYVNGSYNDDSSEIGRLMHDFRCTKAGEIYNEILRDSVRYYKETEGGKATMCSAVEALAQKARAEGEAKGRAEGEEKGSQNHARETAERMFRKGYDIELTAELNGIDRDIVSGWWKDFQSDGYRRKAAEELSLM